MSLNCVSTSLLLLIEMELKNVKSGFPYHWTLPAQRWAFQREHFPQKVEREQCSREDREHSTQKQDTWDACTGSHCKPILSHRLQTHTSVGHCCPLHVKGTHTRSSLLVLIQLIQNWGHYNGPHSALWGHMEIPQLEASAGHRLGCFLVALLIGGSFSYVQRRIIKSFSSLSFPSDSLCDIQCATSNFSSWNWDPRPRTAVWWDMMYKQKTLSLTNWVLVK